MRVNIVDSIMGSGKTSAAINYINNSDTSKRFMYVTPYLSEVHRIISSCPSKNFQEPKEYGTKIRGIKDLLNPPKYYILYAVCAGTSPHRLCRSASPYSRHRHFR